MCNHYLMPLQQWLSFMCHDWQILYLLARHCIYAHGYVTINPLAENLVNYCEVDIAVSL